MNQRGKTWQQNSAIRRKGSAALLSVMAFMLVFATACSSENNESSGSTAASSDSPSSSASASAPASEKPAEPPVELKAFFPGDKPTDFETVMDAVNKKLVADGIGATLNIQFIGWNDYGNTTTLKTSAGEEFDMFLDAPWLHISQMISSNAIIPLDDLVAKAPELQSSIPQPMWDSNKFGGKIYGIPLGISQGIIGGFLIRKDLREKYGLPPITNVDELETFLYKVKEKEKGIVPFATDGRYADGLVGLFNSKTNGDNQALTMGMDVFYNGDKNGNIYPIYERPGFEETLKKLNRFFKDGILEKNLAQQENSTALFNQGKVASIPYSGDGVEGLKFADALKVSGVQLEVAIMNENQTHYSDFKQWNFLCVPSASKHADKVIAVMNWLSIRENHDLLEYGIEGKHWTPIGDDQYKVVEGSQYSFPGYVLTWRPNLVRTPDNMIPDDLKWFKFTRDSNNFQLSPFAGFTPNTDAFKTEYAQISPIKDEVLKPLGAGVLNADKGLNELKDRFKKAGNDKILPELQKQFADFKAGK
ncbi:extracellular solute-binding protein [Cohnella soli]|uniref:Extracellular solute-binding protein n=1 Tax=Cohnella soli TaxID=425005 RepID=A0ABW0HQ96_9BACL